jgi:hypothetical protein
LIKKGSIEAQQELALIGRKLSLQTSSNMQLDDYNLNENSANIAA